MSEHIAKVPHGTDEGFSKVFFAFSSWQPKSCGSLRKERGWFQPINEEKQIVLIAYDVDSVPYVVSTKGRRSAQDLARRIGRAITAAEKPLVNSWGIREDF